MRSLTLWQPWASLVALGAKAVETRSWSTAYRGPLAIHASARIPGEGAVLCQEEPFRSALAAGGYLASGDLPTGAVLAVVTVLDCRPTSTGHGAGQQDAEWLEDLSDQELAFGDYGSERFGWFLRLEERIEPPIPAKGARGLWEWDPDVLAVAPAPRPKPAPGARESEASAPARQLVLTW